MGRTVLRAGADGERADLDRGIGDHPAVAPPTTAAPTAVADSSSVVLRQIWTSATTSGSWRAPGACRTA